MWPERENEIAVGRVAANYRVDMFGYLCLNIIGPIQMVMSRSTFW